MPTRSTPLSMETAQFIILGVGCLGMMIWATAAALWWMYRKPAPPAPLARAIPHKDPAQARRDLVRAAALQTPPWELIGGDENHAIFHLNFLPSQPQIRITVEAQEPGCRITSSLIQAPSMGWLAWLPPVWLILEPVVIVGGGALLWTLTASSANAATRGQALQMVQIVHVLWPPFLFLSLRRRSQRLARTLQDRLLTTVELL